MVKKNVTIDDLAGMVKRGFDGMDKEFKGVNQRFDHVDDRLDRIENFILKKHEREIEGLKFRMKNMEDMLAMPIK